MVLLASQGKPVREIAEIFDMWIWSVAKFLHRFEKQRLKALHDRPRTGRPKRITGRMEAKIVALACTDPPEGRARWSLRLLANRAMELELVETISHRGVQQVLKK